MSAKKKNTDHQEEILPEESSAADNNGVAGEQISAEGTPETEQQEQPDKEQEKTENNMEGTEEETIERLEHTLQDSREKAEEYLDGWQRSVAEFANYKKRINRERAEFHLQAKGEVIKDYLEIVDDLERALQDRPEIGEGAQWAEGIEIIYKKLMAKLEAEGITPMKALGEQFDPNIHEALMQQESEDHESGEVIEVLQEGYWIGDKVLRPALVRIAE